VKKVTAYYYIDVLIRIQKKYFIFSPTPASGPLGQPTRPTQMPETHPTETGSTLDLQ